MAALEAPEVEEAVFTEDEEDYNEEGRCKAFVI